MSFKASPCVVDELLGLDSHVFEIPMFQRRFAWGVNEVSELMDDLFGDTDIWTERPRPYFLGSLVLAQSNDHDPFRVLDGQQRLTALSLLIAVLRDLSAQYDPSANTRLSKYLEAGEYGMAPRPKLRLQDGDATDYQSLIENPQTALSSSKKSPLVAATLELFAQARGVLRDAPKGMLEATALSHMVRRVLYFVKFVKIVAPSESDAFQMFETLNDRGLDLNAADLVQNALLARSGDSLREVHELWRETTELTGTNEIVHFLRYYWLAFHEPVRKNALFDRIGKHISSFVPLNRNALTFARRLVDTATLYSQIASPDARICQWGADAGEVFERLIVFRARSCRPALLLCADKHRATVPQLARLCETATVRFAVCSRNPNLLEKAYERLCGRMRDGAPVLDAFADTVGKEIPDDAEFLDKFASLDVGPGSAATRAILTVLNQRIGLGEMVPGPASRVHIEHVLPQTPSTAALGESRLSATEAAALSGKIGNVTLLSGRKNREISNGPFSKKKSVFASSDISLNRWIADQEIWDANTIYERGRVLAERAVAAWPWPTRTTA